MASPRQNIRTREREAQHRLRELARELFWIRAALEAGDDRVAIERLRYVEGEIAALLDRAARGGA